jgi:protein TonB
LCFTGKIAPPEAGFGVLTDSQYPSQEDTMFAEYVCESPWANRSHRGWTTLVSFAVQTLAVGSLLLLPLIYSERIPHLRSMTQDLVAPASPPAPAPPPNARQATPATSNLLTDGRIMAPQSIPTQTEHVIETVAVPQVDFNQIGVISRLSDRSGTNGVLYGIGNGHYAVAPPPPKPLANPPRVSRMMEGNLIHRVQPEYPILAKMAHVQGTVVLHAVISKQGTIENLQTISGPGLLVQAAKDAVSRWQYRPYYLNGEPVEVDTQVTVNFVLSGG